MKTRNLTIGLLFLAGVLGFTSCTEEVVNPEENNTVIPAKFSVDIPDAISYEASSLKSGQEDRLSGTDIYQPLGHFIKIGERAAEIVEEIIVSIRVNNINKAMKLTYKGDEDGRDKQLEVIEGATFAGQEWEYQLTVKDLGNINNEDGGEALQLFWNTNPVRGIALLKPANINFNDTSEVKDAVYRIDYSEEIENGYSNEMTVYIANLPLANPLEDPYSVDAIKLWAGKDGDFIDVRGNSNHPNARFFDKKREQGFNWAFVASSDEAKGIACAQVSLPPSNLDKTTREDIMDTYGVRKVFEKEIYQEFPELEGTTNPEYLALLDGYFEDAEAPGYFDKFGFLQGGEQPNENYQTVENRIKTLTPFNPKEVTEQKIEFKKE